MVLGAVLTALVIILQSLATFTTFFGPFSTALALIPIVIGAALCGPIIAAWLGFVFGVVVIATGGAALFWGFSIFGTILTVLVKGTACGLFAGLVYRPISRWNRTVAAIAAAVVCPIVNTSVFLLGSAIFFLDSANDIAAILKMDISGMALFWALAMANFIFEIGMNIVLSPAIVRLINIRKKEIS
jgi:uncharacterized membrane protein